MPPAQRQMVMVEADRMARGTRNPQHTFGLKHLPFVIQPFCIAPVLPGESLKNLIVQSRVVTDPIKNPLVGWWIEHYFFYVKLSDLNQREIATQMVIDPNFDPNTLSDALGETLTLPYYFAGGNGQINWAKACLQRIVTEYFRDENDDHTSFTVTDTSLVQEAMPVCQIGRKTGADSLAAAADKVAVDVGVTVGVDDVITAREMVESMRLWRQLVDFGLTEMTYDDYLSSHGIRPSTIETHRPELIRYLRTWSYPTNTIDPTSGVPRSAVSWSIADRASKSRFFKEPGFIVGVTVCRPKVYLRWQKGTMTAMMNSVFSWLPKAYAGDREASWKLTADEVGPFGARNADVNGYWLDIKDLLLYGEQFHNVTTVATNYNFLDLPSTTLNNRDYVPDFAGIQELFTTAVDCYCRQDGVVALSIASTVHQDTSPRGGPKPEYET